MDVTLTTRLDKYDIARGNNHHEMHFESFEARNQPIGNGNLNHSNSIQKSCCVM